MTIDERLDWLIDIEKCTDNIATEDVRRMVAHHAKMIKELLTDERMRHIQLIVDMKYIAGIVKRGTGLELKKDIPIIEQLLDYVKQLEKKA